MKVQRKRSQPGDSRRSATRAPATQRRAWPLYAQLEQLLACRYVASPTDGIQLPEERQLAMTAGVGRVTARQALAGLQRRGWIDRVRGHGTTLTVPKPARTAELVLLVSEGELRAGDDLALAACCCADELEIMGLAGHTCSRHEVSERVQTLGERLRGVVHLGGSPSAFMDVPTAQIDLLDQTPATIEGRSVFLSTDRTGDVATLTDRLAARGHQRIAVLNDLAGVAALVNDIRSRTYSAVICTSADVTNNVLTTCRSSGLRIPEDVSVVGRAPASAGLMVSHVQLPVDTIARLAARLLLITARPAEQAIKAHVLGRWVGKGTVADQRSSLIVGR